MSQYDINGMSQYLSAIIDRDTTGINITLRLPMGLQMVHQAAQNTTLSMNGRVKHHSMDSQNKYWITV